MADPFNPLKSLPLAEKSIKDMNYFIKVYAKYSVTKYPCACIFVPCRKLFRKMLRATIVFGPNERKPAFFMRFGLLDCYKHVLAMPVREKTPIICEEVKKCPTNKEKHKSLRKKK